MYIFDWRASVRSQTYLHPYITRLETDECRCILLRCTSPLLAQSGHAELHRTCPLLGVKRTSREKFAQRGTLVGDGGPREEQNHKADMKSPLTTPCQIVSIGRPVGVSSITSCTANRGELRC